MKAILIILVLVLIAVISGCVSNTPSTGSLVITSEPPGASITLDDTAHGATPATIDGVIKGNHTLSLKYPDNPVWTTTVFVPATGITYIHYTLQVAAGPTKEIEKNFTNSSPNATPVRPIISVTVEGINTTSNQLSVKGSSANGGDDVILSIIPAEKDVYSIPIKKIVTQNGGVFLWNVDKNLLKPGNYSVFAELPGGEYSTSSFIITGARNDNSASFKETLSEVFKWSGPLKDWSYTFTVPKTKATEFHSLSLNTTGDNIQKLQPEDQIYIENITNELQNEAADQGYDEIQELTNIINFVRSIPENNTTLIENSGKPQKYLLDVLTTRDADIRELSNVALELYRITGYPPVLIKTKSHTAIGVPCSSCNGTYIEFAGMKYYYVEPAPGNYGIGEVPAQWRKELPGTISPYDGEPLLDMNCTPILENSDDNNAFYRMHCEIKNKGTASALNPNIISEVKANSSAQGLIWPPVSSVAMKEMAPGGEDQADLTLSIPRSQEVQIQTILYGDNFDSVETVSTAIRS